MKKSGFFQSLFSDIACNVLLFLAAPIMLALYAPEKIGMYATFQAVVGLVCVISTVRLEYTVRNETTIVDPVLSVIIVFGLAATLIATAIIFCLAYLSNFIGPFTVSGFALIVAGAYLFGLFNYLSFKVVGMGKPDLLTKARFQRILVILAIQLAIPWFVASDDFLFLSTGFILSLFAAVVYMLHFSGIKLDLKVVGFRNLLSTFETHRSIIVCHTPSAFLFSAQDAIVFLYISKMSLTEAGIYFIADRLLRTPIFVINQTVRQYVISGKIYISKFMVAAAQLCMTCASFILLLAYEVLKEKIGLSYYYDELVRMFLVLSVIYGFQVGISVLSSIAIRNRKDGASVVYTLFFFASTVVSVLVHYFFPLYPFYVTYVICASLAHLGGFVYIWKDIGTEPGKQLLADPVAAS